MCDKKIETDIIGSYFNFIVNVFLLNINLHWQFPRKNLGTCIICFINRNNYLIECITLLHYGTVEGRNHQMCYSVLFKGREGGLKHRKIVLRSYRMTISLISIHFSRLL